MFPLASGAWQAPHLLKVSESFTGKPAASGLSAGVLTFTSGLEAAFCESAGMEREARSIQQTHLKRTRRSIDSIPRRALFEKKGRKGPFKFFWPMNQSLNCSSTWKRNCVAVSVDGVTVFFQCQVFLKFMEE
jgi:hypothetical protein